MTDFKAIRYKLGITQKAAADFVGVTEVTWRKWENSRTEPRMIYHAKIKRLELSAAGRDVQP